MDNNEILAIYKDKDINLIPKSYLRRKRVFTQKILSFVLVLIILSGGVYWYIDTNNKIDELKYENQKLAVRLLQLKDEKENQITLRNLGDRIIAKESVLAMIDNSNHSVVSVIELLEKNSPDAIDYVNLQFDSKERLSLSGLTRNERSISDFIYLLKNAGIFENVFVNSISKVNVDGEDKVHYSFSLDCEFIGDDDE